MFDFRQPVRRHSIDISLHDMFHTDPDTYVLGGNNDILVTIGAEVQIARQSLLKLPATTPEISGLSFRCDSCAVCLCRVIRLLMRILLDHARRQDNDSNALKG